MAMHALVDLPETADMHFIEVLLSVLKVGANF